MPWFGLNVVFLSAVTGLNYLEVPKPSWLQGVYSILFNLLSSGLISFYFYWLFVYVPEQRKGHIIKINFLKMYRSIKRDILCEVVFASQKGGRSEMEASEDTIEKLLTTNGFRDAFQGGRKGNEGFNAFQNQMDQATPEFNEIVINLEFLVIQVQFLLNNYTIDDEDLFAIFKRLEILLISLRRSKLGYDESKALCRFIYQTFSGWDSSKGYQGYDFLEKTIKGL